LSWASGKWVSAKTAHLLIRKPFCQSEVEYHRQEIYSSILLYVIEWINDMMPIIHQCVLCTAKYCKPSKEVSVYTP